MKLLVSAESGDQGPREGESLGRRGETLTSTRRSYHDRDPAEYSSKVQQRRRHSAIFSEVRTCLLSLNDAQRDPCRHFASKVSSFASTQQLWQGHWTILEASALGAQRSTTI